MVCAQTQAAREGVALWRLGSSWGFWISTDGKNQLLLALLKCTGRVYTSVLAQQWKAVVGTFNF